MLSHNNRDQSYLLLNKYTKSQDKRSRLNKNYNFAFVGQYDYKQELADLYGNRLNG